MVVVGGEAETGLPLVGCRPEVGCHVNVVAPEAVNCTLSPWQTKGLPGVTVMVKYPAKTICVVPVLLHAVFGSV